jgi:hypothetical protein
MQSRRTTEKVGSLKSFKLIEFGLDNFEDVFNGVKDDTENEFSSFLQNINNVRFYLRLEINYE